MIGTASKGRPGLCCLLALNRLKVMRMQVVKVRDSRDNQDF